MITRRLLACAGALALSGSALPAQADAVSDPMFIAWLNEQRLAKKLGKDWPHADEFDNVFRDWLIHGKTDKPVYFVTKIQSANDYLADGLLKKIGEENGFVFLQKK